MQSSRFRTAAGPWRFPAYLLAAGLAVAALSYAGGGASPKRPSGQPLDQLRLSYGPTDFATALKFADGAVALGEERVARRPQDWINQESYARALLGRARLTASFDDLAAAGTALATGKAEAVAGSGPMLTDAVYNFTIHRSAPIAGDLAVVERAAVPPDPSDRAEAVALRGDVAFYSGDYPAAIAAYRQAAQLAPGPANWFRIALWQKKLGRFDDARASFTQAAASNDRRTPQFMANVFLQLGSVELERGDWPAAEQWFARADRRFPGYWLIQAHRVQMWALRGQTEKAVQGYRRILAQSPQPEVMDALAALYRSTGDATASRSWAERAGAIWARRLQQLPEAGYAHALEHALMLGDPAAALTLAQRNMAARPNGDSATLLGWALLANGRAAAARDLLEAVNRTEWRTAPQYAALSQAYAMLGDGGRSAAARAAALAINPRAFDPATSQIWFGHH